jgi:plasmid replication initiation protein
MCPYRQPRKFASIHLATKPAMGARAGAVGVHELVTTGDHSSGEGRVTSRRVHLCGLLRASAPAREMSKAPV